MSRLDLPPRVEVVDGFEQDQFRGEGRFNRLDRRRELFRKALEVVVDVAQVRVATDSRNQRERELVSRSRNRTASHGGSCSRTSARNETSARAVLLRGYIRESKCSRISSEVTTSETTVTGSGVKERRRPARQLTSCTNWSVRALISLERAIPATLSVTWSSGAGS